LRPQAARSQDQRKKPKGEKMPAGIASGNATPAGVRSWVEHVFAAQKRRLRFVVVRARVNIGLASFAYNSARFAWLQGQTAPA